MNRINVLTLNARGLNIPQKRISVLDFLFRKNIQLAFIQETHLLEIDAKKMNNKYYEVIASSCADKKNKGVLIIIRRNLPFTIIDTCNILSGRIILCKIAINNIKMALVGVYAPNRFDKSFYESLNTTLLDLAEYHLLIGRDFNAVCSHYTDRTGSSENADQKLSSKALQKLINEYSLIDTWRLMNPTSTEFSFYSARHKTFSRIDYILMSKPLFHIIHATDMIPLPLSDHRAVICSFELKNFKTRAPRWRFNSSLLQNKDFLTQLTEDLHNFININQGTVDDPRYMWEAVKGCIRNTTISFASKFNKTRKHNIESLEKDIAVIEDKMVSNATSDNIRKRQLLLNELGDLLRQKAEFQMHRARQKHYINSARPSFSL